MLRLSERAHAGKYAYGLGKFENLAEFLIGLLQTILVILAGTRAITRILHPECVEGAELGLFVTAAAVIGNAILYRKATQLARETRSPVLETRVGGLGLLLIHRFSDHLAYRRKGHWNCLTAAFKLPKALDTARCAS